MASIIAQCLLVLCLISAAMAECYNGPLHRRWKGGREERFCLTREMKRREILEWKTVNTDDCYRCSCGPAGLRCCGFGIKAGGNAQRVPAPPGCMLVLEGCDYYFVDIITHQRC
ncbi:hypothetical protein ACOMHN_066058 [Nucella lapillus]